MSFRWFMNIQKKAEGSQRSGTSWQVSLNFDLILSSVLIMGSDQSTINRRHYSTFYSFVIGIIDIDCYYRL